MKVKRKIKIDEYKLKKIEELASHCNSKNDIAAFFGVAINDYLKQEASNCSMELAFNIGLGKMTGTLSKKALKIALDGEERNALQAIKYILNVKDYKNWNEKYQEQIHGGVEAQELPKINFVFSQKPQDENEQASGNKNA